MIMNKTWSLSSSCLLSSERRSNKWDWDRESKKWLAKCTGWGGTDTEFYRDVGTKKRVRSQTKIDRERKIIKLNQSLVVLHSLSCRGQKPDCTDLYKWVVRIWKQSVEFILKVFWWKDRAKTATRRYYRAKERLWFFCCRCFAFVLINSYRRYWNIFERKRERSWEVDKRSLMGPREKERIWDQDG